MRTAGALDRAETTEASFVRAVVLVDGVSDQRALEALAQRRGRHLGAERIAVVPMGVAQADGSFLDMLVPAPLDLVLAHVWRCSSSETDSTWGVCGNMSTGWQRTSS